jgi:hypothetical protein
MKTTLGFLLDQILEFWPPYRPEQSAAPASAREDGGSGPERPR